MNATKPETVVINGIVYDIIGTEADMLAVRRPKGVKVYAARRLADSPLYGSGRAYIVAPMGFYSRPLADSGGKE